MQDSKTLQQHDTLLSADFEISSFPGLKPDQIGVLLNNMSGDTVCDWNQMLGSRV